MDLFSEHIDSMRMKQRMDANRDRLLDMISYEAQGKGSLLKNGGGLNNGGGLPVGGGLMYRGAGSGVQEFGQGFHPELRKIMKTHDPPAYNIRTDVGALFDGDGGLELKEGSIEAIGTEDDFVPEAEAPEEVQEAKKSNKLNNTTVSVQGTLRKLTTNNHVKPDVLPVAGKDYVAHKPSQAQSNYLKETFEKSGLQGTVPFKARGNKQVIAIAEDGSVKKYKSIIQAHKALNMTKHQLTGGKTPKNEFDSHYSPQLKVLMAFVSKENADLF